MSKTFKDHRQELPMEDDVLAQEAESPTCIENLRAFTFNRSVGRLEISRRHFWQRVRWMLLGAAVGSAIGAAYPQVVLGGLVRHIGS
jgi:hypothetical protein